MDTHPTQLKLTPEGRLRITWSDDTIREYTAHELRDRCPCATCRDRRNRPPESATSLPILSAAEAQPLTLQGMKPVGNYAYSIAFSDGHDTGIYSLELLGELGEAVRDELG